MEDGIPKNKKWKDIELNAHEVCLEDKKAFASNFKFVEQESNSVQAKRIIQNTYNKNLIINPPFETMTERKSILHWSYHTTDYCILSTIKKYLSAYDMIKFQYQYKQTFLSKLQYYTAQSRQVMPCTEESILKEVEQVTEMPDFKGYLSDIAGPSANMYKMKGKVQSICDKCVAPSCIHPVVCDNLDTSHKPMTDLYKKIDANPKIKKAFIGSGIRYDLLTKSYNKKGDEKDMYEYLEQVQTRHVSGRLKVAPEHTSDDTLKIMRKPKFEHFHSFKKLYDKIDLKHKLNQKLIPYFISSHPACKEEDMANLAAETKELGFQLEQVQDFTPTPMTVATVIYYSGYHPYRLEEYYVRKTKKDKENQIQLLFLVQARKQAMDTRQTARH